jgi:hypothetical protein
MFAGESNYSRIKRKALFASSCLLLTLITISILHLACANAKFFHRIGILTSTLIILLVIVINSVRSIRHSSLLRCLIIQIFIIGVYRVTIHPLAKYPGPFFAALTDLYNIYHCLSGNRRILFYELHKNHGNSFAFNFSLGT